MIFTRTKADAQEAAEVLIRNGYNADALREDVRVLSTMGIGWMSVGVPAPSLQAWCDNATQLAADLGL